METTVGPAERLISPILAPIQALRRAHLPILSVYATSGALGLIAVADGFWVKGALKLSVLDLASIAVWLQMPWIAKMVVAELVEAAPVLRSSRRLSILIGAGLTMLGLVVLAGAAGRWLGLAPPERLYVVAQLLIVIGGVVQEVVADTLVPGVVVRVDASGQPRPEADINAELAMIEVLARLVYTVAALIAGGLAGWLAATLSAERVYLMALAVPLLSVAGAFAADVEPGKGRAIDWTILGGGLSLTAAAACLGLAAIPQAQEIIFIGAIAALLLMLGHVMRDLAPAVRRQIMTVAALAFVFRAIPSVGDGYRWYAIDRLGFDEMVFGVLQVTGTGVGLVLMWLLARAVTEWPVRRIILCLTACAVVLLLPTLLLSHGLHEWTLRHLGLGARQIAMIDEAAQSPLALLATVPLLALVAVHAPSNHRATWFALTASLMSLAIVAGQLITKYLNTLFPVDRGAYDNLPALVTTVVALSIVMPLAALAALRHRLK